ncbi:MAG: succinate--CoA ligase subunit alpha [Methanomicrobiales archaeon]|nr:succinate--CoA ligase subunit alpha [Methanomicrobiales archaeon]
MIYADKNTGVIVCGATGNQGSFHIDRMNQYAQSIGGRGVVAGVTPGKGGQEVHGVPVYNSIQEAADARDASAAVLFVPGSAAGDSIMEAADAGLDLVVTITEHIPVHDVMNAVTYANIRGCRVIGPNCPGLFSPGEISMGIMPAHLASRGPVGVISRSGTLTYEVVHELTRAGIGQSTIIGIGGDPIIGQTFADALDLFADDPKTRAVVILGELGGNLEEEGARAAQIPVVAFIAGTTAPAEKRMGHAGAIVTGGEGDANAKISRLKNIGVPVADRLSQIPSLISEVL